MSILSQVNYDNFWIWYQLAWPSFTNQLHLRQRLLHIWVVYNRAEPAYNLAELLYYHYITLLNLYITLLNHHITLLNHHITLLNRHITALNRHRIAYHITMLNHIRIVYQMYCTIAQIHLWLVYIVTTQPNINLTQLRLRLDIIIKPNPPHQPPIQTS